MGKKLNTAQQKAVCHETGPMLVLAGPGSGKTTVLLCRISRLLERGLAKPQEILGADLFQGGGGRNEKPI